MWFGRDGGIGRGRSRARTSTVRARTERSFDRWLPQALAANRDLTRAVRGDSSSFGAPVVATEGRICESPLATDGIVSTNRQRNEQATSTQPDTTL